MNQLQYQHSNFTGIHVLYFHISDYVVNGEIYCAANGWWCNNIPVFHSVLKGWCLNGQYELQNPSASLSLDGKKEAIAFGKYFIHIQTWNRHRWIYNNTKGVRFTGRTVVGRSNSCSLRNQIHVTAVSGYLYTGPNCRLGLRAVIYSGF